MIKFCIFSLLYFFPLSGSIKVDTDRLSGINDLADQRHRLTMWSHTSIKLGPISHINEPWGTKGDN